MGLKIAHLCERAFNGGALASLRQIRAGISSIKSDWVQHVIVACKNDPKAQSNPDYFEKDAIYVNYESINKYLHGYDLVCIHKLMNTNIGRLISYIPRSKCKIIVISHTFSVNASNCLVGRPDLCICVSDYMVKTFQKLNPKTRFTRIHNAVSSKWMLENGYKSEETRSGVVGRANTLNLIKYSKKFTEWFSSTDFGKPLIMEYLGGGSIIDEARNYAISQADINKIDFKGHVEDDRKRYRIMSSWEFFLYDINMPEGTSMAILESLALGVPVICSNRPGNNEIIQNGKNGYLFSNLDAAAEIVKDLILNDKLNNLKNNCLQSAQANEYFNNMSKRYVEEIENVFSFNSRNLDKKQHNHVVVENKNGASLHVNPQKDYIIRGGRKTVFPIGVNSSNNVPENKNKLNKEEKKQKDIPNKIVKDKAAKKMPLTTRASKPAKENKVKKAKDKPLASEAFVENVMQSLNNAEKLQTGPKFTILSAGFEKGKYIDDWFNSVISQKYRPLEVVYVDDNSNDETEKLISNLKDPFKNAGIEFVYIKNDTQIGCAKSYQKALMSATGDYFGVLDADDALMPDAVGIIMARYLSNPKISYIWSQYIRCNHDMTMVGSGISRGVPQRPPRSMLEFESHTRRIHCYSHWRTMKRMENMDAVFSCPYSSSVDKFMGYMLEEMGHGHFINLHLYRYRGSVSDGLTATSAQRNNWNKIREDAKRRRTRTRKKVYSIIL
jgi:hypothetical protein